MNKEEFDLKTRIIRDTFNDKRPIKCETPDYVRRLEDDIYQGGDIFTTEDGEFIVLEFQFNDFDEEELAKYIEFAENFYEKNQKHITIYLICHKNVNVSVRECKIYSDADFTIKLYCSEEDPCQLILDNAKNKIRMNQTLDEDDLLIIAKLPTFCAKKDRKYFRVESLKILNRIFH